MESKIVVTRKDGFERLKEEQKLFKWVVKEEKEKGNKIEVTFVRDESIAHYNEIKSLEEQYIKCSKLLPQWPFFVFVFIALGTLTALIIYVFMSKGATSQEKLPYLLGLGLPAIVFLTLSTIYFNARYRKIINVAHPDNIKKEEIIKEVSKL